MKPSNDASDRQTVATATPKYIEYGAAVLLGIAFGVGGYLLIDGTPAAHYITHQQAPATAAEPAVPTPFEVAYEPSEVEESTPVGDILRETATAESVEPSAPADYPE